MLQNNRKKLLLSISSERNVFYFTAFGLSTEVSYCFLKPLSFQLFSLLFRFFMILCLNTSAKFRSLSKGRISPPSFDEQLPNLHARVFATSTH